MNKVVILKPKQGPSSVVSVDPQSKEFKDLKKVGTTITDPQSGRQMEEQESGEITKLQLLPFIKQVGKAVVKTLRGLGDEVDSIKATHIDPHPQGTSFDLEVVYKKGSDDAFSFSIKNKKLFIDDFTRSTELSDIDEKPSGELFIHPEVVSDKLQQHFQGLQTDIENKPSPMEEDMSEDPKDYFEYLEETPQEVQDIVEKYADDMHLGYDKSQQLVKELETVGWTCEYGLDGIPYGLTQISDMEEGMSDQEFADAQQADRLASHPEKNMIEKIQALIQIEKLSKIADDTSKTPEERDQARNQMYSLKKSQTTVSEVGEKDWRFKAIEKLYQTAGEFTKKKIASTITRDPKSPWHRIEQALKSADYQDTIEYADKLGLQETTNEQEVDETLNKFSQVQSALAKVTEKMKALAQQYKAGDTSVVDQLKDLTAKKKILSAELEKWAGNIGTDHEYDDSVNEDHSSNPNDKYTVKKCSKKDEPFAVWEGDVRVKGFKTKEEAKKYADKQNKKQALN